MKCLLDQDGLLSDFHEGALALHSLKDPYINEENLGKYGIEHMNGVQIPPAQFYGKMDEEFWASLQPTAEFDEIIALVESKFGRENVCILTAPVMTYGCLEGKRRWINQYLPQYKNQFLIGKPKHFCAGPDSVLIDDSDSNTKAFRAEGGKTILLPRPWNALFMFRKNPHPILHLKDCLAQL